MILTGSEIKKEIATGNIIIEPFNEKSINPNSYNLRLDDTLYVYKDRILDMRNDKYVLEKITIPETGFLLVPGQLYLGKTMEYTATDKYLPMLEGRSSVGRLGICIHITAGFGDVGFKGNWTLEITCTRPVKIYPYVNICQIYYNEIKGDIELYDGKYQNSREVLPSKLHDDFISDNI